MKTSRPVAFSLFAAAALLAGCGGSQPPIGSVAPTSDSGDSLSHHKTFAYTGETQSFKVPAGVTKLSIVARGAAGAGESASNSLYNYAGRGGRVYAVIPVKPDEKLYIFVGGQGSTVGGYNGGGNPGSEASGGTCYGGGGASDVRADGRGLGDRILVAAGGGGQGCEIYVGEGRAVFGGGGGPGIGQTGGGIYGAMGGAGGTQSQGGSGGSGGGSASGQGKNGQPGTLGQGGSGGAGGIEPYPYCNPSNYHCAGGGGGGAGGGYYGGGGGGGGAGESDYALPGGGGGGASSYVEPYATKVHLWRGWKNATGNGLVVFSW